VNKRKHEAQWVSFKKIIDRLREGGLFYPRDLERELHMPDRTVDHDLKLGVKLGIFIQKEKKGPYAWIDYRSEEEIVRRILRTWFPIFMFSILEKEKMWNTPIEFIEEVVINSAALEAGKDPRNEDFRKICYEIARQFFSKPEKSLPPEQYKRFREKFEKKREELLQSLSKSLKNSQI